MKITINQKEVSVEAQHLSVAELVALKNLPSFGIAVAVNDKVVRKDHWEFTMLHNGDNVTIITAVCGG